MAIPPARAHPADEATVEHYLWLKAQPGELRLQQQTMIGGLLTQAVWADMDRNGDNALSTAEQEQYARKLAGGLTLRVDAKPLAWKLQSYEIPPHDAFFTANFPVKLELTAPLPKVGSLGHRIVVEDQTFPQFRGVFGDPVIRSEKLSAGRPVLSEDGRRFELLLLPAGQHPDQPAAALPRSDSPSKALGGLIANAPANPGANAPSAGIGGLDLNNTPIFPRAGGILYAAPRRPTRAEGIKAYLTGNLSPGLLALALLAALVAGMAHALTPGHGKAMVGAYLVGTRGSVWDAVFLGLVVTITHTAGVYLLGLLCLWLTTRLPGETAGLWLSIVSGVTVLGMGFWLFQRGLLAYHGIRPMPGHSHESGPGVHTHAVAHEHSHAHDSAHGHEHTHATASGSRSSEGNRSVTATARRPPSDSPQEEAAPLASDQRADRWGLIGLGVAGGMVPCFDALAILIAAVHLRRILLGLALIAAFSVGMAAVLVAIGVLMVTAKGLMQRFTGESRWVKALPAASGAVLFLLGVWLTFQSLAEAGILRFG